MADNIITQVSQDNGQGMSQIADDSNSNIDYNSKIHLNIRGKAFEITRDELMSLPESILLSLFPNGVFLDMNGQVITNLTEEDVVYVNFDPECFEYIFRVFGTAQQEYSESSNALSPQISGVSRLDSAASILQTKPAIIVLREDLDYYVIPPAPGLNAEEMKFFKVEVGKQILSHRSVFAGLGFKPELPQHTQVLGPAEQHLFDMLCSSGFEKTDLWGCRSMEPSKCVLSSLSLVRLVTQRPSPPESPSLNPVSSNTSTRSRSRSRIATLASNASRAASRSLSRNKSNDTNYTKLLLFWRKPARKCWWANESITVPTGNTRLADAGKYTKAKAHIRRVWTLELSVVGVQ